MMRRCIHSLSLGLWPIQLPRRGSLGYVLLFLALSYLYMRYGRIEMNLPTFASANISHLRSKYFIAKRFHLPAGQISLKKAIRKSEWLFSNGGIIIVLI